MEQADLLRNPLSVPFPFLRYHLFTCSPVPLLYHPPSLAMSGLWRLVGAPGFEPGASASRTQRSKPD